MSGIKKRTRELAAVLTRENLHQWYIVEEQSLGDIAKPLSTGPSDHSVDIIRRVAVGLIPIHVVLEAVRS